MANFIVNLEQNLGEISTLLGLNEWELQTASYAGISFFIVPSSWDSFNPFSAITKTTIDLLSPNIDPNQNLGFDTKLGLENIRDSQSKKLAIKRFPNYDGYFIRDNGSDGIIYEVVGLLIGPDYLTALQNIKQTMSIQKGKGSVFVHPVYGKLQNCFISNFNTLFNSTEWRAATFTMRIIQSGASSNKIIKPSLTKLASDALNLITSSIATFGRISAAIITAQGFLGRLGITNTGGQTIQATPAERAAQLSASVTTTQATLESATTIVYQQLAKPKLGITNYTFMNTPVNYNNLPTLFRYSAIQTDQFSALLQYYANSIGATIALYRTYGVDTIWSDDITALKQSLVQLDAFLATVLAQIANSYITYTLPSTYSVRQVFFYNGLDFNDWNLVQTFIEQNRGLILDLNVIPKGTSVYLPTSNIL